MADCIGSSTYTVKYYNYIDAEFGYDPGPQILYANLQKAVAKSIARHLNKTQPDFVEFWVESETERFW